MGLFQRLRHRIKHLNRRDLRALLVCILISATIWSLRTLTEDSTDVLQVPLAYVIEAEGLQPVGIRNRFIEIEVKASGFGIIGQRYFRRDREAEVRVTDAATAEERVSIPTSNLRDQLRNLVGADRDIVKIRPDTLHFFVSRTIEKEIPLFARFSEDLGEFAYLRDTPTITPANIRVKGPRLILDTLSGIFTKPFEINGAERATVNPMAPEPLEVIDNRVFEAVWSIDRWSTTTIKVPVLLPQTIESGMLTFLPDSVEVSFIAGTSRQEQLSADDFRVIPVANTLHEFALESRHKVSLKIDSIPNGVRDLSLTPGRVEFLIYRKAE